MEWTTDCPKVPGLYKIRCLESGGKAVKVNIFMRGNHLYVGCPDLGVIEELNRYHSGLTSIMWRQLKSK